MYDIKKILTRSWHVLWNYRMLWVFGFLLALAVGSNYNDSLRYTLNDNRSAQSNQFQPYEGWEGLQGDDFREQMKDAFRQMRVAFQELRADYPVEFRMGVRAAIVVLIVALLLSILVAVLRYVAETAAIRMVDEYEQSGLKVKFRQAWKYGWTRSAWRVFLANFVAHLPALVMFGVVGLVGWWIFSAVMSGERMAIFSSLIAGIGLAFLFGFLTAIVSVVLRVMRDFAWRKIVLEGAKALPAMGGAWALLKRQWKNIGLTWLVTIGLRIGWTIAFAIILIPLMIVSVVTALGGAAAAIVPGLVTAGIASLLSAPAYWPWIFAAIVAMPFFAIVTFSPMLLVSGWFQIYQSSVWTLAYRELKALESVTGNGSVGVTDMGERGDVVNGAQ